MTNTKYQSEFKESLIPLNKGINRKAPYGNSGEMEDLLNLKPDEAGILRPVRSTKEDYSIQDPHHKIIIHKRSGYKNYINYVSLTNQILYKNVLIEEENNVLVTLDEGEELYSMQPFLNYLIVTTSNRMLRYLYNNNTYTSININLPIHINIDTKNQATIETDKISDNTDYDSLYANLIAKINSESEAGRLTGAISWRAAYKLIDGSYLMITPPKIVGENIDMEFLVNNGQFSTSFNVCNYQVQLDPGYYDVLEEEKDIISSLVVFFSKQIIPWDIESIYSEDNAILNRSTGISLKELGKLSDDFINIGSPDTGWYKACEIPFTNIIDKRNNSFDQSHGFMNIDDWYQTYAAGEACPVDQYTHHSLTAEEMFVYNSRLWLARMNRAITLPDRSIRYINPEYTFDAEEVIVPQPGVKITGTEGLEYVFSQFEYLNVKVVFKINTGTEKLQVVEDISNVFFSHDGDTNYTLRLPIIAYPDQRAYSFSIYVYFQNAWKEFIVDQALTISQSHNFAYYFLIDSNNLPKEVGEDAQLGVDHVNNLQDAGIADASDYAILRNETIGENQFQLSELSNPLIFPAIYNYVVGDGIINWFAVSTNPISDGQFGQYPVIISTSNGIYAANIGTGDVIITNVIPLTPDISITRPASSINGVFFGTKKGIMVINGNSSQNISIPLDGRLSSVITSDEGGVFLYYSSHNQIVQLSSQINQMTNFIEMLEDMELGYDYQNDRLLVSKSTINHTWVYDLRQSQWYRLPFSFKYFTNSYPDLLGATTSKLLNLSDLIQTSDEDHPNIQTHFHTKIINIGSHNRKKIHDIVLRCSIKTEDNRYPVFAIFASNDNKKWSLITGGGRQFGEVNDIHVTRSHASYKFYLFAFWAELVPDYDNRLESIEMIYQEKYKHKKRSY